MTSNPPRLPFALAIGVTGHRLDAISADALPHVERRLGEVLDLLAGEARTLAAREAAVFAEGPPTFTLVSPLADGADQIAAEVALARGFRLQAILPFSRNTYLADFDPALQGPFPPARRPGRLPARTARRARRMSLRPMSWPGGRRWRIATC